MGIRGRSPFILLRYDGATNSFTLTSAGGNITVGGTAGNQVTVTSTDAHSQTAGEYRFNLRDMSDDTLIARGVLVIEAENDAGS